jgi:hypothetical protein
VKRSSAQKQVANFFSEVLTTGFYLPSGEVVTSTTRTAGAEWGEAGVTRRGFV